MKDDIFRLDIPVNDTVGVELVDGLADLSHDGGYLCFWHALMLF